MLELTPMPDADIRYQMGSDGYVYACTAKGGNDRAAGKSTSEWRRLSENNGKVSLLNEAGKWTNRLARNWWAVTHPAKPWPRGGGIVKAHGNVRGRKVKIHLRIDYEGEVWPRCDEDNEDARVTSIRARVTCPECRALMDEDV